VFPSVSPNFEDTTFSADLQLLDVEQLAKDGDMIKLIDHKVT